MKSFDVVNVLSQRNVCREVQVEEKSVTLNGQADVLLISLDAYLGEWSTHLLPLLPLSPLFATSAFQHVSLL